MPVEKGMVHGGYVKLMKDSVDWAYRVTLYNRMITERITEITRD